MTMMRACLAIWLISLALAQSVVCNTALETAATAPGIGRFLLQSGISCPKQIPGCSLRRCTTRVLNSKETYVCLRCQTSYVPVKGSDGRSIVQCVCPSGTYEQNARCVGCDEGTYCPGGDKKAAKASDDRGRQLPCNPGNTVGLTTKAKRSSRASDCVAMGGYVLPKAPGGAAAECPVSTYSLDYNRLKSCLPCQSGLAEPGGFKANGGIRNSKDRVCKVPPGRFWELNVVRDCPVGLYREGFANTTDAAAIACRSCPEGWTTPSTGSPSRSSCNKLLPGHKVASVELGAEPSLALDVGTLMAAEPTELCPLGFFYDGSQGLYGCKRCPLGSTTRQNGSTMISDCLVPPGYYVQSTDGINGELAKCPTNASVNGGPVTGYYRSLWVTPSTVIDADGTKACKPCGAGIPAKHMDVDELVDLQLPADLASDPSFGFVSSSSFSCYIEAGWGITFDPMDFTKYRAIAPCPANTYGVAYQTFGLFMAPCKSCTKNLYSQPGSTSMFDCKNPGGFGYTSEGANQCPDGFWAAKDSMAPCEPCPEGRTTDYVPGNGAYQVSIESCKVLAGFGVYSGAAAEPWAPEQVAADMAAKPCPVDYASAGDAADANATANPTCQRCLNGQGTSQPASSSCDVCLAGYGGSSGSCSICPHNTYQAGAEYGDGVSCRTCPSTTFNSYVGDAFTSYGITFFTGMTNSHLCVPRYSQTAPPAGSTMGLPDSVFVSVPAGTDVASCVTACPTEMCCIAEYDDNGETGSCRHALLPPAKPMAIVKSVEGEDIPRLYYKLPPSELIAAASVGDAGNSSSGVSAASLSDTAAAASPAAAGQSSSAPSDKVNAKTWASGIFAVCDMSAWQAEAAEGWVGTSTNPALVEEARNVIEWDVPGSCSSEASCHASCVSEASCWGFIYVPGKGFALRGGKGYLGVRSFFVSPDPAAPATSPAADGAALADPSSV